MSPSRDSLRKSLGTFGETFACHELQRRGYTIVNRNVRFKGGEIDIVARDAAELVFVEVKTRRPSLMSAPEDAITAERMTHLEAAIDEYLDGTHPTDTAYRIEVVAIEVDRFGRVIRFDVLGDVGIREE